MTRQECKITPDKYQKQVIDSKAKDVLVLAGAGSGKTFTLLSKISKLVNYENIDPRCILVLTFTRVAAEHMREKYLEMNDSNYNVSVPDFYTFHAFCYKVLSEYKQVQKALVYDTLPTIADDQEIARYQAQAKSLSSCKLSYGRLKNINKLNGKEKRQAENYYATLKKLLRANNVIDYDSLSEKVCNLIASKDYSVLPVIERYKYLFVDEFQDTDENQYKFVKSMNGCCRVLCGDALQNIYQFRGCSNVHLKELCEDNLWVKLVLPVNYRSSAQICQYVNNLSKSFHSKDYRVVLKSNVLGPCVRVYDTSRTEDYNDYLPDLAKYVNMFSRSKSVAVLCRTNLEVSEVVNYLSSKGIKCSKNSAKEYSLGVVKSVIDKDYSYLFFQSFMDDHDYSLYKALKLEGMTDSEIFSSLHLYSWTSSFSQAVRDVKTVESVKGWDIQESSFALCNMFEVDVPSNVESFDGLMYYLLNRVQSKQDNNVYVGTIHSVKGLEFDCVAVMGVNSKSFKIDNEERENLLYTACTRAKNNLLLFANKSSAVCKI